MTMFLGVDSIAAIGSFALLLVLTGVQLWMQQRYWLLSLRLSQVHSESEPDEIIC